jgi:hypothetical protein
MKMSHILRLILSAVSVLTAVTAIAGAYPHKPAMLNDVK